MEKRKNKKIKKRKGENRPQLFSSERIQFFSARPLEFLLQYFRLVHKSAKHHLANRKLI